MVVIMVNYHILFSPGKRGKFMLHVICNIEVPLSVSLNKYFVQGHLCSIVLSINLRSHTFHAKTLCREIMHL